MDGLLVDSERLYTQAFRDALTEFDQPYKEELWLSCIGTTAALSRQILSDGYGPNFPLDALLRRFRERYYEIQEQGLNPLPYVPELLAQLQAWRLPLGLVTSTPRTPAGLKLYRTRLGDYFSIRVCGGEVKAGKPSPDPYLRGAVLLGLSPADCLVLEDSANGVRAAVAAGAQVIQVPDQVAPSPELIKLGHTIHDDLGQTLGLLRDGLS